MLAVRPAGAADGSQELKDILAGVYAANPQILAARSQLRAINEAFPQAVSNWLPSLSVSGTYKHQLEKVDAAPADTTRDRKRIRTGTLSYSQTLYRGGRNFATLRQAEHQIRQQRNSLSETEQSVFLNVITAYMNVIRDSKILDLRINNVLVLEKILDNTKVQYDFRRRTQADLSQAEARLYRTKARRSLADSAVENSFASYFSLVGDLPGDLKMLVLPAPLPNDLTSAIEFGLENNFRILSLRAAIDVAKENVTILQGARLPSISFDASASKTLDQIKGAAPRTDTTDFSGIFTLTVPLYQSGSEISRVRAALRVTTQRREELENSVRSVRESIIRAWNGLKTSKDRIDAFKAQQFSAKVALDSVSEELEVGRRTVLDLLDAEQELLDAKVNNIGAQRDSIVAAYTLLQSIGQLTPEYLDIDSEVYDADSDFRKVKWNLITTDVE